MRCDLLGRVLSRVVAFWTHLQSNMGHRVGPLRPRVGAFWTHVRPHVGQEAARIVEEFESSGFLSFGTTETGRADMGGKDGTRQLVDVVEKATEESRLAHSFHYWAGNGATFRATRHSV